MPSTRSLVAGFVLAVLLCGVNSYLTLSFGVIEEGPTIAALFFFAMFFLSKTRITTSEMVIVATMGSAGGSLGFISNFFAARTMTGSTMTVVEMASFGVVTSLLGMFFVVPLRELLVLKEKLPWPGSKATESVIRSLVEAGDHKQPWILLVTGLLGYAYVVANRDGGFALVPDETALPILGLGAFGLAIAWSPFAFGAAYLMGMRVCVGFLLGAITLLAMAPYTPAPEAPHRYVWPGIAFLVATGLTALATNWRVVVEALSSLTKLGGGDDDDPVLTPRAFAVVGMVALVVTLGWSLFALDLNILVVVLLIAIGGGVQNVIATRAAAVTAFNPARVMGVLLEGVAAAAGAPTAAANLTGAGFVAGSGAQAGNLTGDMAYGRWLGVPSRWQFWAQLTTILPCAVVSAVVYHNLAAVRPPSLEGGDLPAPVAKMWAATAQIFAGSAEMPPGALQSMAIAGIIGVIWALIESRPDLEKWIPSSIGVGIGLVLPVSYDLAFFFGGVLLFGVGRRVLKIGDLSLTSVAVGLIVAEGIGGISKPVLSLVGVIH